MTIESTNHAQLVRRRWIALVGGLALLAAACSSTAEDPGPVEPVACAANYVHERVGVVEGGEGEIRGLVASPNLDGVMWLARSSAEGPEIVGITKTGQPISGLSLAGLLESADNITVGASRAGEPSLFVLGSEDGRGKEPKLLRIEEIDPYATGAEPSAQVFELEMADGSKPVAIASDDLTGDLIIVGQDRARTLIYRLPPPGGDANVLRPETVARIDTGVWPIKDVDLSADGSRLAMRTRNALWLWGRDGESLVRALAAPVCVSSLPRDGHGAALAAADGALEYIAVGTGTSGELQIHRPTLGEAGAPGWRTTAGVVNIGPTIEIVSSLRNMRWEANQRIDLELTVEDDQPAEPGRINWTIDEARCVEDSCKYLSIGSGNLDSFLTPATGDATSVLRISATYSDPGGLRATDTVEIAPTLLTLPVESSPLGAQVSVGATEVVTPAELEIVSNSTLAVSAPPLQELDGVFYDASVDDQITATSGSRVELALTRTPWGFVDFSGEEENFASRSVSISRNTLDTLDLRAFVALDDWTPTTRNAVLGGDFTQFALMVMPSGRVQGRAVLTDGVVNLESTTPAAAHGRMWLRFVYDFAAGEGRFYTSPDDIPNHREVAWTQLGSVVSSDSSSRLLTDARLLIVGQQNQLAARPLDGKVFAAAFLFNDVEYSVDFTSTAGLSSRPPNYARWGAWTIEGDGWTYIPPPN